MLQNNFNGHFKHSLKERKHFHFELACATTAIFRVSNIETLCLKQSGRIPFVDTLLSLYTELGRKGTVEGIIAEQPKASRKGGALFMLPRLGGLPARSSLCW